MSEETTIRHAVPDDYNEIIAVMDQWWGRPVSGVLPRLFLQHFYRTSFVAEEDRNLVGFLVGFLSPDQPGDAYIHFIGVSPRMRRTGLARNLYERFFDLAGSRDITNIRAVTPVGNTRSQQFHRAMGFDVSEPKPDYHGVGRDRIVFTKFLA
ncbi:N-acetyltransferase family protein [Nocardia rhamnosiphila]